ncbi:MAG: ABC transporter ATP-binding protein [Firmicutes bacterium]|jgi:spermidine/putrescine ABC transporter ATP-binding subunit|nr:ABC transporter ATP-binding protein [Bacillota bacterium]
MKAALVSEEVRLDQVTKRFGDFRAVDGLTLLMKKGKLTTLLGPSGCGKTTTLRMIAGFIDPDEGDIFVGKQRVNNLPPFRRDVRTVFQNYALFPHMTVFENVAYGLRIQGIKGDELKRLVREALEMVGLGEVGSRLPGRLSGGQQQRIAFARAVVTKPKVLLLDEPLSNLDAKLRVQMREEVRRMQRDLGITTIYVTHDQEEAMSISDMIAVMNAGKIEQIGSPSDIYERPSTPFVAQFIGLSNLLDCEVVSVVGERTVVDVLGVKVPVHTVSGLDPGQRARLVARPERMVLSDAAEDAVPGTVRGVSYLGSIARYTIALVDSVDVVLDDPSPSGLDLKQPGDQVFVRFRPDRVYIQRA